MKKLMFVVFMALTTAGVNATESVDETIDASADGLVKINVVRGTILV